MYTVSTVYGITSSDFLDRNLRNVHFCLKGLGLIQLKNEQYVFSPQISDTKERIWSGVN